MYFYLWNTKFIKLVLAVFHVLADNKKKSKSLLYIYIYIYIYIYSYIYA